MHKKIGQNINSLKWTNSGGMTSKLKVDHLDSEVISFDRFQNISGTKIHKRDNVHIAVTLQRPVEGFKFS